MTAMSRLIVIIPALNAAASLADTFASLEPAIACGLVSGWVLADGGSHDATVKLARARGFDVVKSLPGRGVQLAAGADRALAGAGEEDWLLFLHADTRLEPGWARAVKDFIAHEGAQMAGYFRFALDDASAPARRLERFVAWRCAAFGLPYGDQGLLIPARFYAALGGYRLMRLFEDVDIARRIGKRRLKPIPARAITSAARFREEGYLKRSAANLLLLTRYFLGADPEKLARAYHPRRGGGAALASHASADKKDEMR
ncbi:MAG: family 2 glycosyl transferase [Oceanicaulis sp. HLUCCA04]|nr:MAG: family 2 glycosyl transferase [Oceanicaulis sp. HLUCCA04]